jgi:hypothetical protein
MKGCVTIAPVTQELFFRQGSQLRQFIQAVLDNLYLSLHISYDHDCVILLFPAVSLF